MGIESLCFHHNVPEEYRRDAEGRDINWDNHMSLSNKVILPSGKKAFHAHGYMTAMSGGPGLMCYTCELGADESGANGQLIVSDNFKT